MSEERAKAEEGEPWFLAEDEGAPDLDVQAGISSNLRPEDLALLQEGVGSGPPTTPREAVRPDRPPSGPSSGTEPDEGFEAPGTPVADHRQGQASSVFPVSEPETPRSPHSDPEAPPTTSAFDRGQPGTVGHSVFEDTSQHTQEYGERSAGDTLAPPAPDLDITPTYTEPVAAEPTYTEYTEPEPGMAEAVDVKPEPSTAELEDIDSGTAEPLDVAAEPEHTEPAGSVELARLVPEVEGVMAGDLEAVDTSTEVENPESVEGGEPAHIIAEPEDVEPGYVEPAGVETALDHLEPERSEDPAARVLESLEPDLDITPVYTELAASGVFDQRPGDSEERSAQDPSAFSVFEATEPDPDLHSTYAELAATSLFDRPEPGASEGSPKAGSSEHGPRDEEPLRSALLQSFKDVVARAPAVPDGTDESESLDLEAELAPEEPEPQEVIPRKPQARPRRF